MAFKEMKDDLDIISKYPDEPYEEEGFTSSAFKARFDMGAKLCKTAHNALVRALNGLTAATNIGFYPTSGVNAQTVQDAIENVQSQIAGVSQGAVPAGSINTEKLGSHSVTYEKLGTDVQDMLALLDNKADKATTLEGYGITDGVTEEAFLTGFSDMAAMYEQLRDGKQDLITDTGWSSVTNFSEYFGAYSETEYVPQYRKIGSVVYVRGAVKPKRTITPLDSGGDVIRYPIFTLPSGFRPTSYMHFLCQGRGSAKWFCTVQTDGTVTFSRNSDGSGFVDAPSGVWLPFSFSFPAN